MRRRELLAALAAAGCASTRRRPPAGTPETGAPRFRTDHARLQAKWDAATRTLAGNVVRVHGYERPVLIEGDGYPGIWLECGPHESLVYAPFAPEVAVASHDVFFALQREDGYLPCYVWAKEVGTGQIQMVVPIAATALEVFERTGDGKFLQTAYQACSRWDAWLRRYRNTRGTGLCEAFCGYDTGHDHSPRFRGLPWQCPDKDARICPKVGGLPFLAPDLSATMYGGRRALARMARHLGRSGEEARWLEEAETLRKAIFQHCFDEEDACFFDRDASGKLVRIRGDALLRVLAENVVEPPAAEEIFRRHVFDPQRFWAPFPFPSIALDDPAFDRSLRLNSWGGAAQALAALRAPRWMGCYGKRAQLAHLMRQWLRALLGADEFRQQLNPWTGEASTSKRYSPAMLAFLDFVGRLHGVQGAGGDMLVWGCGLPEGATTSVYELPTSNGMAVISQDRCCARISIGGRLILRVTGEVGLQTRLDGRISCLYGTARGQTPVTLHLPDGREWVASMAPNQVTTP